MNIFLNLNAGTNGEELGEAEVTKIRYLKKYKTHMVTVKVSLVHGTKAAGIIEQPKEVSQPLNKASFEYLPENGIVCQCEKISLKETIEYIKEHKVRDISQLKNIRINMGACGGRTCSVLLPRIFNMAGVDWNEVTQGTIRPLSVEVPMFAIINEKLVSKVL